MAFATTQDQAIQLAGFTPPLLIVTGTYLSSAGGTGGVIAAGYTNSNGSLTAITGNAGLGGRTIIASVFTPTASDATAPGSARSYNTTLDAQVETLVTTADTGGRYMLICLDNGA